MDTNDRSEIRLLVRKLFQVAKRPGLHQVLNLGNKILGFTQHLQIGAVVRIPTSSSAFPR